MLELLYNRRSIRKFLPRGIEEEKVDKLLEGLLLSPSGRGRRPWEFVVVDDKDTIVKLSEAKKHGSAFLKTAPLAVVVLGDPDKSDTWIEDTSIASVSALLVAESIELGACWIQIRGREHSSGISSESYIKDLLRIPDHLAVESVIAIGYPDERPPAYTREALPFEKIHRNRF